MSTKSFLLLFSVCMLMTSLAGYAQCSATCAAKECKAKACPVLQKEDTSVLDFTVKDIEGNEVSLEQYKGKALLIVNVASKCGYTKQYAALEALYDEYKGKGLEILAFPANNFNEQEPGTNEEIKLFCTTRFSVSFPLFAKISVAGNDSAPLYTYLTSKESNPGFAGDISWNFTKFLVDCQGKVVARFSPNTKPDAKEVKTAIEKALAE